MDAGPEREAAARLAQHLAVAVQVAEAVIRLQAQRAETRAAGHAQAAAAGRAERTAQHAADRVVWSRALDPRWAGAADLADLGRAWGAAAGWADTDPTADVAARRVEARLAEMAPTAMTRFDQLRAGGLDRTAAMRAVLGHLAAESSYRPRVFVAEPGPAAAGADARTRTDTAAAAAWRSQPTPDQPATSRPDQPAADAAATDRQVRYIVDLLDRSAHRADRGPTDPAAIATLGREQASAYIEALGGGAYRRTTAAGHPHAGDVAGDSYPRRYRDVRPAAAASPATGRGGELRPAWPASSGGRAPRRSGRRPLRPGTRNSPHCTRPSPSRCAHSRPAWPGGVGSTSAAAFTPTASTTPCCRSRRNPTPPAWPATTCGRSSAGR